MLPPTPKKLTDAQTINALIVHTLTERIRADFGRTVPYHVAVATVRPEYRGEYVSVVPDLIVPEDHLGVFRHLTPDPVTVAIEIARDDAGRLFVRYRFRAGAFGDFQSVQVWTPGRGWAFAR